MSVITAEGLCASSGTIALSDISFELEKGELAAVLGACGAGKSCLAALLAGLLSPSSGKLEICGMDALSPTRSAEVKRHLALVIEHGEEHFLSGYLDEELSFAPLSMGLSADETAERVRECLAFVGLAGYERRSPQLLSLFQRKRAALAAALATGADVLVLDEVFAGLPQHEKRQLWELMVRLCEKGTSILFLTREPDEAAMAERVLLMARGRGLAFGKRGEILSDDKLLERAGLLPGFALRVFLDLEEAGLSLENRPVSLKELVEELCR